MDHFWLSLFPSSLVCLLSFRGYSFFLAIVSHSSGSRNPVMALGRDGNTPSLTLTPSACSLQVSFLGYLVLTYLRLEVGD